jgi:endonuclease/exonuclease/phosphatase family metal-dependent hydrolase
MTTRRLVSAIATLAAAASTAGLAASVSTTPATAATAASTSSAYNLRVGSFNVRSVQFDTSRAPGEALWKDRRGAVVSDILAEDLDAVGLQEASQNPKYASHFVDGRGSVGGTTLQTQYFDIRNGLNAQTPGNPWAVTSPYLYNCVRLDNNTNCVYRYHGASRDTKILYRKDRLTLGRSGSVLFKRQSGGLNDGRYFVWAKFTINATGKQFFFATTHLMNGSVADRKAEWQEVIQQINFRKGPLPVEMTGDFQSSKFAAPSDSMLPAMQRNGYGDVVGQRYGTTHLPSPHRPQVLSNGWLNSENGFHRDMRGWAYENEIHWAGNNIDWIFASNRLAVKRWREVANFDRSTMQLVGVIPSDHNLVTSTIVIP